MYIKGVSKVPYKFIVLANIYIRPHIAKALKTPEFKSFCVEVEELIE